jgi:selenide,water dikinase
MREAGAVVIGGHSVEDPEPKFGYCVVGEAAPTDLVTNAAARPGDLLVLTKPIGTGVIATAIKAGVAREDAIMNALASMTTLNRNAAAAMREAGARAATDVTGFGLLGHLHIMLRESGVAARVHASSVPFLPGAIELAQDGHVPGGTRRNVADREGDVTFERPLPEAVRTLLFDAQTSGGLLIAVPPGQAQRLVHALGRLRAPASAIIGEVRDGAAGAIAVVP